jgi:hypothetical protein
MYENRIMNPIKYWLKGRRQERAIEGSEFDQSTLYVCIKISQ